MTEFTGERVIPGEVNEDLWAEHVSRYAFASRYSTGKRALDIGCGTGYGTAELAQGARAVTGIDIAPDAIAYARAHYPLGNIQFIAASAGALPFANESFDLATAFEVIEHLPEWTLLLAEARRVLHPDGVFLISTPNKLYYSETRASEGPNPFHHHEFEFSEFLDALRQFFPRVEMLQQNRLETFAFTPCQRFFPPLDSRLDATRGSPTEAHFFVAVCGIHSAPELRSFLYVPRASNLLREREQHIELLNEELTQTKQWLAGAITDRQQVLALHAEQTRELEEHNRWALRLEKDWKAALQRIQQLQDELQAEQRAAAGVVEKYSLKVAELEQENLQKTNWALETETRLSMQLASRCTELAEAVRLLDAAEATVIERTHWGQDLQSRLLHIEAMIQRVRESRWLKLGRAVGLGPRVDG